MHPDIHSDITLVHHTLHVPIVDHPAIPSVEREDLRCTLIDEEVNCELLPALRSRDLVAIADAICDAIVVIMGTAVEYGIPFDECWREVQRTNLAKVDKDGQPIFRADGKFLKPEGWTPPDIEEIIFQAITRYEAKEKEAAANIEQQRLNSLTHDDQQE